MNQQVKETIHLVVSTKKHPIKGSLIVTTSLKEFERAVERARNTDSHVREEMIAKLIAAINFGNEQIDNFPRLIGQSGVWKNLMDDGLLLVAYTHAQFDTPVELVTDEILADMRANPKNVVAYS
jgi:hypothetical protein